MTDQISFVILHENVLLCKNVDQFIAYFVKLGDILRKLVKGIELVSSSQEESSYLDKFLHIKLLLKAM